jgi:outer membrane protein assembly factor BamB
VLLNRIFISSVLVLLSGCSYITGGSDNSEPPTPLSAIQAEKSFKQVWNANVGVGDAGHYLQLQPLVLSDKIITVDAKGLLQATNRENGSVLWKKHLNIRITQGVAGNNDKVFVSTDSGYILALNSKDGSQLWQQSLNKNILNNPYYDDKNVYIQTTDGTIYSLASGDGAINWDYKMTGPDLTLYSTSSPTIWRNLVIAGFSNGKIVAFNKNNGTPQWDYQVSEPKGMSSIQRMNDVSSKPLIIDEMLYAVSYQGKVIALDLQNGVKRWEHDLSSISDMVAGKKHLYVSDTEGTVWALNRATGQVLWQQPNLHMRKLSGTNYINDMILVGDYEGYLHGLSSEHGGFIARIKQSKGGIRVAPIVKDDIIYILDNSGKLAAYKLEQANV